MEKSPVPYEGVSDWRNIYIVSVFAFVDAFQFSFFVWSFWPFVQQLDPTISPSFIGLIMALSGVGEAVSAPLFGYWTNRVGRVNPPLLASLLISMVGNASYMCLNGLPKLLTPYALLFSRFLSGAGSGNRGTYLAHVAAASTDSDRTRAMALSGGGALIGLTAGPSVQMAFTWIGSHGLDLGWMRISMYTAPAILALVINVSCVFLLTAFLDDRLDNKGKENDTISTMDVAVSDDDSVDTTDTSSSLKNVSSIDVIAVLVCMTTRSARMLVTSNMESIGSPYSQLMFGFNEVDVLHYNSLVQSGQGFLTGVMFIVYACTNYTKWVSERVNCVGAMIALLFFHLLTFSWPFLPGSIDCASNIANGTVWEWCETLRPVNVYLFYGSYVLVFGLALPCLNNSLQSLYSLVLGSGRQGTLQGLNQSVGSISRILGPLVMSTTFTKFGPQATWGVEIGTLALFLGIWAVTYRRLVPASQRKRKVYAEESVEDPIKMKY